jgi:transcriptional regulator with XRE-family HTH domain
VPVRPPGDDGWPSVKSFGDSLKQAREERGVTLDAIAQNTRISRKYLLALERSDLETLPGGAFDQGYIRTYSQFLGIDAGPILEAYKERERQLGRGTAEDERQRLTELSRLLDRRAGHRKRHLLTRSKATLVVASLMGFLGTGLWLLARAPGALERPAPVVEPPTVRARPTLPAPMEPGTEPASRPTASVDEPLERPPFTVSGYGVGTGVVDHQLVGRDDRFAEGTEVWFWTRVVGAETGEVVRHIWMHEGQVAMASELRIGGPHWRTYSRLTLPPGGTGSWSVEARTRDGRTLARQEFVCIE